MDGSIGRGVRPIPLPVVIFIDAESLSQAAALQVYQQGTQ